MRQAILGLAALVALLCTSEADAAIFTGVGVNPNNDNNPLSAQAQFEIDPANSSNLIVTLTNTADSDAWCNTDILTALFFSIEGEPTLTPISAMLAPGTQVYKNGVVFPVAGGNVGGEWAYKTELTGAPQDATQGISSVGLDMFGKLETFDLNLAGPDAPNGLDFGITSAGDDLSTQNGGLKKSPITKNSVVFQLGDLPTDFELTDIYNVNFQYGTSLDEGPNNTPPVVPEPATIVIWSLLGLCVAGACRWRRRSGWSPATTESVHGVIDRGRTSR